MRERMGSSGREERRTNLEEKNEGKNRKQGRAGEGENGELV
jgi:hypothetical protein